MEQRRFANTAAALAILVVVTMVVLAALAEIAVVISLPGSVYVGVGMIAVVITGLVTAINSSLKRWAIAFLLLSLLGVVLRTLFVVDWTPRKPFVRDLDRIQIGMTKAEVEQIMKGYIRMTPSNTGLSDELTFRHSEDDAFNADCALVRFQNGRVVSVDFAAD